MKIVSSMIIYLKKGQSLEFKCTEEDFLKHLNVINDIEGEPIPFLTLFNGENYVSVNKSEINYITYNK